MKGEENFIFQTQWMVAISLLERGPRKQFYQGGICRNTSADEPSKQKTCMKAEAASSVELSHRKACNQSLAARIGKPNHAC